MLHYDVAVAGGRYHPTDDSHYDDLPPIFAICLLTKDDVDILPEWIAYHYYAMKLQHLVVAVDPTSQHNPNEVLQRFRNHLGNKNLTIDQWSDDDFLPTWFTIDKNYGQVPNFMGLELHDQNQTFGEYASKWKYQRRQDMTIVNNHRYRQTTFIAKCCQHLYQTYNNNTIGGGVGGSESGTRRRVLVSTLDSDEYLVVNPRIVSTNANQKHQQSNGQKSPKNGIEYGSVLQSLLDSEIDDTKAKSSHNNACVQVPRLLFGSKEDHQDHDVSALISTNNAADKVILSQHQNRSLSKLETIRWKYHASYNDTRNFQQKVILDLNLIDAWLKDQKQHLDNNQTVVVVDDVLYGDRVNSVHRPIRALCPPETYDGSLFEDATLAAYHYIGSWERYSSRKDLRRNRKRYRERSNITFAKDNNIIDSWISNFVDYVGIDTASRLLKEYVTTVANSNEDSDSKENHL